MSSFSNTFNVLYVKDIELTHSFYQQLGVEVVNKEDDKVQVKIGSFDLHFILDSTEPLVEYQYATTAQNRGMGVLFYLEADQLEELSAQVTAAGGKVMSTIKKNQWDGEEFLFEDPDGYKFVGYRMLN